MLHLFCLHLSAREHEYILNNVYDLVQRSNIVRLLNYLRDTQKSSLDYMQKAKVIRSNASMQIDGFSKNNLELTRTIRSEDSYGTLFWLLDRTQTNMGSRLLKKWISKPLCNEREILIKRYMVGISQSEIANSLNISQAQVSRLESSAINTLRKLIR